MTLNETKIIIDPEKYYSSSVVILNKFFPWIKSVMTFTAMLRTPEGQELYKPIIRQTGMVTRFKIKGSTIIEIRKLAEEGKLKI